jgi:hypothetical protein
MPYRRIKNFQDGRVAEVKRGNDNTLKCNCGKRFGFLSSLQRHAKSCRGDVTGSKEGEEAMALLEDNSDALECLDFNEEVNETPIDCNGALISCEIS